MYKTEDVYLQLLCWNSMAKATYKRSIYCVAHCSRVRIYDQYGKHGSRQAGMARGSSWELTFTNTRWGELLHMMWAFETSALSLSEEWHTSYSFSNSSTNWRARTQTYEPMKAILIQTTIGREGSVWVLQQELPTGGKAQLWNERHRAKRVSAEKPRKVFRKDHYQPHINHPKGGRD